MAKWIDLNCNTFVQYLINVLGVNDIFFNTKWGIAFIPTKTYKEINTLNGVFYKTPWARSLFT